MFELNFLFNKHLINAFWNKFISCQVVYIASVYGQSAKLIVVYWVDFSFTRSAFRRNIVDIIIEEDTVWAPLNKVVEAMAVLQNMDLR